MVDWGYVEWDYNDAESAGATPDCAWTEAWWIDTLPGTSFILRRKKDSLLYVCAHWMEPFEEHAVAGPFDTIDAAKAAYVMIFGV